MKRRFHRGQHSYRLLDAISPLPDPFDCLEDYERYVHRDLDSLTVTMLHRELEKVKLRLLVDDEAPAWFAERLRKVKEALHVKIGSTRSR